MASIIIPRCIKKPGLIVGARTYRLIFNETGLYIIQIGKAMMDAPPSDPISGAIANSIIDKIAAKREKEMAEVEAELAGKDLNSLIDNKKSYFIRKENFNELKITENVSEIKLKIKSSVINIDLYFHPSYKASLELIVAQCTK